MSGCVHCTPCALQRIESTLKRMELLMASEIENLNQIKQKVADVHADVKAKLDDVRGEVSPEGQAAFDEVLASLDTFDSEIGDADGSDNPPANPGQSSSDQPAAEQSDTGVVAPENATDENGTPLDADGNPLR